MDPRVLSLTPKAILDPVRKSLQPCWPPRSPASPEEAELELPTVDFVIGDWTHASRLDAEQLTRAARCLCVFQPTAGIETIDVAAAADLGIPVANVPDANNGAVAEWTVMAILAMLKEVWRHHEGMLKGRWDMVDAASTGVYELAGRTVGIIGMGRIGRAVAERLAGFQTGSILYADARRAPADLERRLSVEKMEIDDLCTASDVLTLHLPLSARPGAAPDARRLALLPPHAVLINAARGAVIDGAALCTALDSGQLKAAALDVFAEEPLPADHTLRNRANVLLSPHLAGSTNEARERMVARTLRNLDHVLREARPPMSSTSVGGVPRRDAGIAPE